MAHHLENCLTHGQAETKLACNGCNQGQCEVRLERILEKSVYKILSFISTVQ